VRRALAALALALVPAASSAVTLTLDEAAQREAVATGARSVANESYDAEWRVKNPAGDTVMVMTPFHRLAAASRNAAFNGKPLKASEPGRILKETKDRLVFWVELRGRAEDFARYYEPRLLVEDREIKAAFVQNERTAVRQEDGRYLARCMYGFPSRDVPGGGTATLVVSDGEGRDISRFTINLARMR
jgi:hypothetical protein